MSLQFSKEMTFSPYNSLSRKQGSVYMSIQASPNKVYQQEEKQQLQPNDLFKNQSYQQQEIQNIKGYCSNNKMQYNVQQQSQGQYTSEEYQQTQSNIDTARQNNKNESTIVFMDRQYKQNISEKHFLNQEKPRIEYNSQNENYSSSYIINNNNNISSIHGTCSDQSNHVLNYDFNSLLDSNCTNSQNDNISRSQILQYDQIKQLYPNEQQQIQDDLQSKQNNHFKNISNSSESNIQFYSQQSINALQSIEKNQYFYQQNNNHCTQNNLYDKQQVDPIYNRTTDNNEVKLSLNQNNMQQRSQSICEQNMNQNNNFSNRRNSLSESSYNNSNQIYNQNYNKCINLKKVKKFNHYESDFENQNIDYSNIQPQCNQKSQINTNNTNYHTSNFQSNNKQQLIEQMTPLMDQNKKVLFSMIIEIPDGRHEAIEVYENVSLQDLSYKFCIKNNMEIQKYCQFIANRLQAALNHYISYQSPKKDQQLFKQCIVSKQQKYINNQDSAVFQVTNNGITCTSQNKQDQKYQTYQTHRSQSQHQTNNDLDNLFDQQIQKKYGFEKQTEQKTYISNLKNQQEQNFEQPQKSLIYELDLSDLPDEICYNDYDDQTNAQIIYNTCSSFEQKKSISLNEQINNSKKLNNIKNFNNEYTINPIENVTQKLNEQLNIKNCMIEQQIESSRENMEQLKQNIQKSLAQQYNIQQDFNRRRNYYSQYESAAQISNLEKNPPQKFVNLTSESLNSNNQALKVKQPEIQSSHISNHFNHYDILKYQESQESNKNKQSTQHTLIQLYSQNNNESNKNVLISQEEKSSMQTDSDNLYSKDFNRKEIDIEQTKQHSRRLSCQLTNIYPQASINSFQKNEKKISKDILQNSQINDLSQYIQSKSEKQQIKSLFNKQNNQVNKNLNFKKQNKSLFNTQQDEQDAQLISSVKENGLQNKKNFDKFIKENDQMKMNKMIQVLPVPYFQKQKIQMNYFSNSRLDKKNFCQDKTKNSINLQERSVRESQFLKNGDESGLNIQQELYKNYKNKKGQQDQNKLTNKSEINISKNDQQISTPSSNYQQSTFSFQQQTIQNSIQNDQNQTQSVNPSQQKRMSLENKNMDYQSYQSNINQNQNELKNDAPVVHDSQIKNQQLNSQRSSFVNVHKDDKQQIDSQRSSLQQNKLSSILSQNKGIFNTNGSISSRSTHRNSICFASVNQNLISVKRNIFSINNLQKPQIQQMTKQQSSFKENQPNYSTNILSARGQISQPSSTKGYDSIPSTNRTPNKKQQEQQLLSSLQQSDAQSDNIDSIKRTIFSSILKSNPTQTNDVKQIKINLSPFIQENKQHYELNDLLNLNNDKIKYNQLKLLLPVTKRQQSNSKERNNSCSTLRSSKCQKKQNQSELSKHSFIDRKDRSSSTSYQEMHAASKRNGMQECLIQKTQEQQPNKDRFSNEPRTQQNTNEQNGNQQKFGYNQNFKQRILQIFSALDSDNDGYISFDKIEVRVINDLVLFIITPILIELCNIQRNVKIEEFNCAFLKLYFNLPKQQQEIIMDPNVEIVWMEIEKSQNRSNLEYFNFYSPLYQQYIEKKNTIQQASQKAQKQMLEQTNKEFLDFYINNFKTLVQETTKYLA